MTSLVAGTRRDNRKQAVISSQFSPLEAKILSLKQDRCHRRRLSIFLSSFFR